MNMACYQRQFFSTYIDKYTHTYAGLILHQLEGVAVIKCCQGRLTLALKCNKTNYVCLSVCLPACLPACLPTFLCIYILSHFYKAQFLENTSNLCSLVCIHLNMHTSFQYWKTQVQQGARVCTHEKPVYIACASSCDAQKLPNNIISVNIHQHTHTRARVSSKCS